jgi:VWFA-related protein
MKGITKKWFLFVCIFAASPIAGPEAVRPQQPTLPRPTFDAKAELVLVDVTVADRTGTPVPDLTAADFELQVNGQPRPIQSLQFISTTPAEAKLSPRDALATSNQTATTGRLLLFAVDEGNLRMGASRAVLRAAQSLMERLAPGDLVAVARLPLGYGSVEFTADRARIVEGLSRVTGTVASQAGMSRLRLSEAYALETNDVTAWQQTLARECAGQDGPGREACASAVEADARMLVNEAGERTRSTLRALEGLVTRLAALETPINIVLISEGLFVARERQDMSVIASRAAEARATIHVVRPSQPYFDVEEQSAGYAARFFDDGLLSEGLEQLAGQTRGSMTTVGASPNLAFDRLGRELSGYYLLGFEPTEADRTGRERRIRVHVKPRGLTVRARPTFVLRPPGSDATASRASGADGTVDSMEALRQALSAPLPARALPIRVATYTVTTTGSSQVRVVISAEIGEPAKDEAEWPIGIVLLDKDEKVVVNRAGPARIAPATTEGESPRLLLTAAVVEPGDYTLRIGAVDDRGRAGSVHHAVHARLSPLPGSLGVSDLVLAPRPSGPGDLPRPRPSSEIDGDTLSAMIELAGNDRALLGRARVTVQVRDSEDGPALVTANAQGASRGDRQRSYAATLKLGVLPPGEYLARATVSVPGHADTVVTRPFRLAPPPPKPLDTSIDLTAPLDPDAPPAPLPTARIIAPVPAFQAETVMAPEVLRPFVEGLADLHPPSPEVQKVLDQARAGQFGVGGVRGETPDDDAALWFVRGLQAYQQGQMPQAATYFEKTLDSASDFLGAAFYLGATYAASGRDKDAIGAWQMALLSENPGAVYPLLVDALLRVGDSRQAIDVLQEAQMAWEHEDDRLRREAIAQAMLGDYASALPTLVDLLGPDPRDQNLLFVAIQVLYRMQAEGGRLTAPQKQRFADYVARHQKMGGPNTALVETWRKYVLR